MQYRTHPWLTLLIAGLLSLVAIAAAHASLPAGLQTAAAVGHATAGVRLATSATSDQRQRPAPDADHALHAAATGAPMSDDTPHRPGMAKRRSVVHRVVVVSTRVPDIIPASPFPVMAAIGPVALSAARVATSIRHAVTRAATSQPEPALRLHPGQAPPAHA